MAGVLLNAHIVLVYEVGSLNGASIPFFCIYKQCWDLGGVSELSTNRKHEGITSEAHSMHPAKGDCPSQSCWKACVSVFVIERE